MQTPEIRSYADGIHAIDTGFVRPGLAASFLLVRDGRAAFVDTGYRAARFPSCSRPSRPWALPARRLTTSS